MDEAVELGGFSASTSAPGVTVHGPTVAPFPSTGIPDSSSAYVGDGAAPAAQPKPKADSLLGWFGSVITAVGIIVVLFAAYLFGFTPYQHSRSQHHLTTELQGQPGLAALTGHVPPEGHAVAVLEIPAVHLKQVVVEGTSAADLTAGPGLMPGSALPGTPGNSVIAGRKQLYGAPFARIGSLSPGDKVTIISGYGTFVYKVTRSYTVSPGQPDPVTPTADNRVTLVTSNSSLTPTERVVVVAKMTTPAAGARVSRLGLPPLSERALSGDAGSLLPAILWGIALIALLLLTVRLYVRWHKPWPTYIMTTPVLIVLAILFFQDVARLLPATL